MICFRHALGMETLPTLFGNSIIHEEAQQRNISGVREANMAMSGNHLDRVLSIPSRLYSVMISNTVFPEGHISRKWVVADWQQSELV